MAAALVATARTAAQAVTDDSSCPEWLAVLTPLANHCGSQVPLSLEIVDSSALCFVDEKARKAYPGDDTGTSTWSIMRKTIQGNDQAVPRLFLCASTYRSVGTGSKADDWHCVLIMRLNGAYHIFSTGGDNGEDQIRVGRLTGMAVFTNSVSVKSNPMTVYFLPQREARTCVADSLQAAIHIFEAVEVRNVGAGGILTYAPLMNGRRVVEVTS